MNVLLLVVGIALLYFGGEALVSGATALGRRFGLSPLVVGLTIVSTGTSSPELAASLAAVLQGSPDVAVGNVVGSNIANLALVLGLTALVWPLQADRRMLRREVPAMIATSSLLFVLVSGNVISRLEGIVLCVLLAVGLALSIDRTEPAEESPEGGSPSVVWPIVKVALGIVLLVAGARALVSGAVGIARAFQISERVIGLTVVAFGTSLPELASSLVAALKRHSDLVLGNLIGSNIFNVLFILGVTATVKPIAVDPTAIRVDLWVMMGISILVWILLASSRTLHRWEGAVLCSLYAGYIVRLFL